MRFGTGGVPKAQRRLLGQRARSRLADDAMQWTSQYGRRVARPASARSRGREAAPLRIVTEVSQYRGERAIGVACTQLGPEYTTTRARKIVDEWARFFAAGPSAIAELHFVTRTPQRLFASLEGQSQLRRLVVKWGDYQDLSVLGSMTQLETLQLGGASSVRSLEPLARLTTLTGLELEALRHARDASPLASLTGLRRLELGGDWMSPRIAHIDSIAWLPSLHNLEHLLLHTVIVDDLDYAPLLALPKLRAVRVMEARGMRPSYAELKTRLPWSE